MREIKFRAWNKEWSMMSMVDKIEFDNGVPVSVSVTIQASDYDHKGEWEDYEIVKDIILQQFTGLLDKNGKEIYEGDILGDIYEGGYIGWCDKCKSFQYFSCLKECMSCLGDVHWYELLDEKLEVIGNIFENTELIK